MQYLLRNKISYLFISLCISSAALAQSDEVFQPEHDELPYYFGMSIGFSNNYLAFNRANRFFSTVSPSSIINPKSIVEINPINNLYYNLGLVGTLRLTKHILLRANPTLLIIGTKNVIDFKIRQTPDLSQKLNVSSSIIHLPVAFKFQSDRYNGFRYANLMRHYLLVGGKFDFDLASNKAGKITTTPPTTTTTSISVLPNTYPSVLSGTDLGAEIGLGVSFYLRYATISPEVKFSYGLKDLHKLNGVYPLMNNLDKVNSNFVYFTIHIEN
jgi:hypothetical protein